MAGVFFEPINVKFLEDPMKTITTIAFALLALAAAQSLQAKPGFGELFYNGGVVRTVVPPAAAPMRGRDNIYPVANGVDGQLPIAAVAPGDRNYHGGKWAVHVVMWLPAATPYLLTSEDQVLAAYGAGDIAISRVFEADFKCPIQP